VTVGSSGVVEDDGVIETASVVLVMFVVTTKVVTTMISRVVRVVTLVTGGFLPQTYQHFSGTSGQKPWEAQV